jgi:flagellar hook-length control protein FliK
MSPLSIIASFFPASVADPAGGKVRGGGYAEPTKIGDRPASVFDLLLDAHAEFGFGQAAGDGQPHSSGYPAGLSLPDGAIVVADDAETDAPPTVDIAPAGDNGVAVLTQGAAPNAGVVIDNATQNTAQTLAKPSPAPGYALAVEPHRPEAATAPDAKTGANARPALPTLPHIQWHVSELAHPLRAALRQTLGAAATEANVVPAGTFGGRHAPTIPIALASATPDSAAVIAVAPSAVVAAIAPAIETPLPATVSAPASVVAAPASVVPTPPTAAPATPAPLAPSADHNPKATPVQPPAPTAPQPAAQAAAPQIAVPAAPLPSPVREADRPAGISRFASPILDKAQSSQPLRRNAGFQVKTPIAATTTTEPDQAAIDAANLVPTETTESFGEADAAKTGKAHSFGRQPAGSNSTASSEPASPVGATVAATVPAFDDTSEVEPSSRAQSILRQIDRVTEMMANRLDGSIRTGQHGVEANLRLDPPDLGGVRIILQVQHDAAFQARFIAERPETAQLIQQHLNRLHETLTRQGLFVERLQVGVQPAAGSGAANAHGDSPFGNPSNQDARRFDMAQQQHQRRQDAQQRQSAKQFDHGAFS